MAHNLCLLALSALLLCWTQPALGQFRVARMFANEMVLQMEPKSSHVWGFGAPGAEVTLAFDSQLFSGTTAADGKWSVRISPQPAGGPHFLGIAYYPLTGLNQTTGFNILFGDVWVCSGQSNMELQIHSIFNATAETDIAATYTNIRIMQVASTTSDVELEEIASSSIPWSKTEIQMVPGFSALCLMFGERMSDSLGGRPIGLIASSWGGTRIEAWSSARVTTFCNSPPGTETNKNADNVLWNGMLSPLASLAVRGAIWYQGENNAGYNQDYYACHMQRLTEDWKNTFVDGNVAAENGVAFPFGIVQLGPSGFGNDERWSELRWHQSVDQGVLPNAFMPEAFMAAAYDLTDRDSPIGEIHPRDKQTVATRLANAAKSLLYSQNHHMNGAVVDSIVEISPGVLTLTYNTNILVQATNGFSYRLQDGLWVETYISGSSGRDVTVTLDPMATHLAYGWTVTVCEYKQCAIYGDDAEALPAQIWLWDLAKITAKSFKVL